MSTKKNDLNALRMLVEAAKDLKREGRLTVWKGAVFVLMPLAKFDTDGNPVWVRRITTARRRRARP